MEVQKPQTVQITFNNKTITLHNVTIVDADPSRIVINRQFAPVNATVAPVMLPSNNPPIIPTNSPKISRLKSPTSSPVAKKKFNGTQNQSELDLSFQCSFCDDMYDELDHLVAHMKAQHPDLISLPDDEEENVKKSEEINKNTHSTTNSVGEDDFDEYIEEEEEELGVEEQTFELIEDETESNIEYDETSCSSSRPPSSPPSPEYEEHVSFSRLEEMRREMEMEREKVDTEKMETSDIIQNGTNLEEKSQLANGTADSESEDEIKQGSDHAYMKHNNEIPENLNSLPEIPKDLEIYKVKNVSSNSLHENIQQTKNYLDSLQDYEGILKYSKAKSSENVSEIDTNSANQDNELDELQQIREIRENYLMQLENHEKYLSKQNWREEQEKLYSNQPQTEDPQSQEMMDAEDEEYSDQNGLDTDENFQDFEFPAEENYPESGENSDNESFTFDMYDQEMMSMLEPICELKSEDDEKSSKLNDEAMELYRMAMEMNYLENGIKKRGKRKNMPTIDENSAEPVNNKVQNNVQESVIKLPQGPGRGRRREMDEAEVELINSGPNCFFQCNLCDKSYKFAGDLAKHVRSHTLNRPYQCSICDKSFTHIGSLNTHLRIHR